MTVKLPAIPAVTGEGNPATVKVLAAIGLTLMPGCVPVPLVVLSVTVSDCVPAVFRMALKLWTPWSAAVNV